MSRRPNSASIACAIEPYSSAGSGPGLSTVSPVLSREVITTLLRRGIASRRLDRILTQLQATQPRDRQSRDTAPI